MDSLGQQGPRKAIEGVQLDQLSRSDLDELPVGVIKLDREGVILEYNRRESEMSGRRRERVVGRNFFEDVAPCTQVPHFEGRFRAGVLGGHLDERFIFNFDFEMTPPVTVLVEMTSARAGDSYWLLTSVVNTSSTTSAHEKFSADATIERADEVCAAEPIHRPCAVQSWGVLVVFESSSGRIVSFSDNFHELLRISSSEAVEGTRITDWFDDVSVSRFKKVRTDIGEKFSEENLQTMIRGCKETVDVRATENGGLVYLEIGIKGSSKRETLKLHDFFDAFDRLQYAHSVEELCEEAVQAIAGLTGFSRCLIYRFDSLWNGNAVAEANDGSMPSLLGLHFPETDIPRQARALYQRSLSRFTPSRDYQARTVRTVADAPTGVEDLSSVQLRSVAPVHRLYHQNIGVNGSMSLSLIVDGELWGLIIAHHQKPHYLDKQVRRAAIAVANKVSNRLSVLKPASEKQVQEKRREISTRLFDEIRATDELQLDALTRTDRTNLTDLLGSGGAAVMWDGNLSTVGSVPASEKIRRVIQHAFRESTSGLWHSTSLAAVFDDFAEERENTSGAIVIFPDGSRDQVLIWFFPEQIRSLEFAGNPHEKSIQQSNDGQLSVLPRESFDRWIEVTRGRCAEWSTGQLETAQEFGFAVGRMLAQRSYRLARLSEELSRANQRFSALINSMSEAILVFDEEFEVIHLGGGAKEMLKISDTDDRGMNILKFFDDPGRWRFQELVGKTDFKVRDFYVVRDDGVVLPVEVSVGQWYEQGRRFGVAVFRDRSERERLEEIALRQIKMDTLGQIAGSVAHDFNNILTIVSANLDLLEMDTIAAETSDLIVEAQVAVRRGSEMTNRLLSILRNRRHSAAEIQVETCIRDNQKLLMSTLGDAGKLEVDLSGDEHTALLEPGSLENMLINLVANARDALRANGEVTISTRSALLGDAAAVEIKVRDNGIGMDESTLQHALEAFFTTKGPGKGTGLGLSSVKKLVDEVGGAIDIESEEGLGTTVRLRLLNVYSNDDGVHDQPESQIKILFADDEDSVRRAISTLLERSGFDVTAVASVSEAIELLESEQFDCVLTDMDFGSPQTGLDICQRALAGSSPQKVILLTGDTTFDRAHTDLSIKVLYKPFNLKKFQQLMDEIPLTWV